jgi:hypothetical protein
MKVGTRVIVTGLNAHRGKVGTIVGRQPLRVFQIRSHQWEVELDEDGTHVFTPSVTRYRNKKK